MQLPIKISTREEYEYVVSRGWSPLFDTYRYDLDFAVRLEIQQELFPQYNRETNLKFYRWFWDNYPLTRRCEEYGVELDEYASYHISHILPRGGETHMAYDARNINLLSKKAHDIWGDPIKRREMHIFERNQKTIETLRRDYAKI